MKLMQACEHGIWEHRKRTKSNGVVVVTKQCMECGGSRGEVPKAKFDLSKIQEFDQSIVDNWNELQRIDDAKRRAEFESKQGEWWVKYNQYLNSGHWSKLRASVLRRDTTCQVCFNSPSVQVHHVSYEGYKKFGLSFPVECCGVCLRCHDWLHEKRGA